MTTTPTRRERLRQATREEIKAIARRHIAAQGAGALSLRAIARDMGLTAPALYRYFDNRDALLTALILDGYAALADALAAADAALPPDDYAARARAVALAYRDWALAHPQDYALMFGTRVAGFEASPEAVAAVASRSTRLVMDLFLAAGRAGRLRLPPEYAAPPLALQGQLAEWAGRYGYDPKALHLMLVLWARLHGLVSLETFGQLRPLIGDPAALYQAEVAALPGRLGLAADE